MGSWWSSEPPQQVVAAAAETAVAAQPPPPPPRRRQRETEAASTTRRRKPGAALGVDFWTRETPLPDALLRRSLVAALLALRAPPLWRFGCVATGGVEATYGAHAHCYVAATPDGDHGAALAWDVSAQPLRAMSVVCLARVANSCAKRLLLVFDDADTAAGGPRKCLALKYRAQL